MQTELFSPDPAKMDREYLPLGADKLSFWRHAIEPERAAELVKQLQEEIPWQQVHLWLGGRKRAIPRLQCWMGDRYSHYGYSGMRLQPAPWHEAVMRIKERVEKLTCREFNSVLLNLYRNGQDSVSWHADDEQELGPRPGIASVSLGAERQFQLKPKSGDSRCKHQILLPAGSLLFMEEGLQDRWLHQIPKVKGLTLARINLTFRRIIASS